jgi:hypothetical protein
LEWREQFEIFEKIISKDLAEQGLKYTVKNAAEYLGVKPHKYQAWKDGQRPVAEDLRMLAQEFEFYPNWLLLGIGEPRQARLDHPFDPKYVEICDTLHELVRALPDRIPKIAELGGMTTTDLYNCIHTQAFPPAEAVAKWVIHYRINANFLLAQIGKPFLTEAEFLESGPLDFVRDRRGDTLNWDDDEDDDEIRSPKTESALSDALNEVVALSRENRQLRIQIEALEKNQENPASLDTTPPQARASGVPLAGRV